MSAAGFLLASVSITFTSHYVMFLLLRFFVAAFGSGLFLPNFVIRESLLNTRGVLSRVCEWCGESGAPL